MTKVKIMNNKFDELTKGMAQSVTRRGALKKFGAGLAGIALAALGLASEAQADSAGKKGAGSCDHCNIATNYGCINDPVCFERCYQKCTNVGGG
jgi:hypothetical protein